MKDKLIGKLFRMIFNSDYRMEVLSSRGLYDNVDDETFLKKRYHAVFKRELNLSNPRSYNEKLQWLKLYDRRKQYTLLVDKYEVKKYVSDLIGEEYVIPTLGVWDSFDQIDFDSLPDSFVLKTTHDSGGVCICKNKHTFNYQESRKKLERSLKNNYYYANREWPYKNVKPRIIAEEYVEDTKTQELRDYKFFAFGGVAKMMFIATSRQCKDKETTFDFFDMDYNHLPFTNGHPNADELPEKPEKFELMKNLTERLSQKIPQVRVDFYEADGRVYFGEMTFFHWSGLVPFEPSDWDDKIGDWIILPSPNDGTES